MAPPSARAQAVRFEASLGRAHLARIRGPLVACGFGGVPSLAAALELYVAKHPPPQAAVVGIAGPVEHNVRRGHGEELRGGKERGGRGVAGE